MNSSLLISLHDIQLQRQGKHILQHISINIEKHDFITIIGPNGAGKSMLLKVLLKLQKPDSGTVTYHKKVTVGYMPQRIPSDYALPITAQDFLCLTPQVTKHRVQECLAFIKAESLAQKQLHILSGGEMQWILLARALLRNPDILILDEPAQNLDLTGQLQLYRFIQQLHQQQKFAVVMVSHDLHMVLKATKRVICLYHHICCEGSAKEVSTNPVFLEMFGEGIEDVVGFYQHHHNHTHQHLTTE